jgi:hypothetical protein
MKRVAMVLIASACAVALAGLASPAWAYGGGANHDMWQVGLSLNCTNPTPGACDQFDGTGGFWGWAEFDRSADGSQTWGDAEFTFCFHTVGGGGAGAGHSVIEIESWTIEPGSAGPDTFYVTGEETDSFRGAKFTYDITHEDTGIPSDPGHYSTVDFVGFTMPGLAAQMQVKFRPAH